MYRSYFSMIPQPMTHFMPVIWNASTSFAVLSTGYNDVLTSAAPQRAPYLVHWSNLHFKIDRRNILSFAECETHTSRSFLCLSTFFESSETAQSTTNQLDAIFLMCKTNICTYNIQGGKILHPMNRAS